MFVPTHRPRLSASGALAAAAVLTVMATAACGGSGAAHKTAGSTPTTAMSAHSSGAASSTPTTAASASSAALSAPGTVVTASCVFGSGHPVTSVVLHGFNMATGKTTATVTFTLPPDGVYVQDPNPSASSPACFAAAMREMFNKDYSRLAVVVLNTGGGSSIGYIDAAGHLTKLGPASTPGFADPVTAVDPVFDPSADRIWYVDNTSGHVFSQTLDSSAPVDQGAEPDSAGRSAAPLLVGSPPAPLLLNDLGYPIVDTDDGRDFVLAPGQHAYATSRPLVRLVVIGIGGAGPAVAKTGSEVFGGNDGSDPGNCAPVAWVSADEILCTGDATWSGAPGTKNLWTVTVPAPGATDNTSAALSGHGPLILPVTHNSLSDVHLMPDHKTVYFVVPQGGGNDVAYRASLDTPGAQPTKVDDPGLVDALAGTQLSGLPGDPAGTGS